LIKISFLIGDVSKSYIGKNSLLGGVSKSYN